MPVKIAEKSALTLCLLLTSLTGHPLLSLGLVAVVILLRIVVPALRPTDKPTASRFWRVFGFLSLGAVIMTALNGGLIREGSILFQWKGLELYEGGIMFGIRTGARLLLMTSALMMLFGSTPLAGITSFLHQAGVPHQIVMTVHLTVHFVASMPGRIERIYSAQEARGAPVRAHFFSRLLSLASIVSPLVLSSIVESIERGKALELRGYHGSSPSSSANADTPEGSASRFEVSLLTAVFLFLAALSLLLPWLLG
jgi:energy-coupling factor transporter transmembrane protein EcfT